MVASCTGAQSMETRAGLLLQPSFGELLARHREAARLTQDELAERAELSVRGLRYLEQDLRRPYRETVRRLAEALALTPQDREVFQEAARQTVARQGLTTSPAEQAPTAVPRQEATVTLLFPDTPRLALAYEPAPVARHNLPTPLTRFIGRQPQMVEVQQLLAGTRLLTLTGAGGCGKTRLALELGASLVEHYADGVWFVDLAPLNDPMLVLPAIAHAAGVRDDGTRPPATMLAEALCARHLLLVLDNCEHLIAACATAADTLLQACPHVQILATSREVLRIAGETAWRVPSLTLPTTQTASPESLKQYEAVRLFLDRATAVQPHLEVTTANAGAVLQICQRLDGIPLALELAATRLSGLGMADLAARLDQRFHLLTGGNRTAVPRQQTLQATVEWSYDLLTPDEQLLFARTSVFAGGWSLEGAEAVGAGDPVAREDVLDLLARLVEKSLVIAEGLEDGRSWYRLLETLRQYGRERLAADDEIACRGRHLAYYLALAERAEQGLTGPEQPRWLDLLERENDNLRAALSWCLYGAEYRGRDDDTQMVETGLRLAGALFWFWFYHDHHPEALMWLNRLLTHGAAAPPAVRAKALYGAGIFALHVNDPTRSEVLLSQSVALSRAAGDRRQCVLALCGLGFTMCHCGQDTLAVTFLEESVALAREVGEPWPLAIALLHWLLRILSGAVIHRTEERARARAAGAESLQLMQAVGDPMSMAIVQQFLGQIAQYEGDYVHARAAFVASLPTIRALGWRSTVADILVNLADVARAQGDSREAIVLCAEALPIYRQAGSHLSPVIASVLARLADIALEQGDQVTAQTHVTEMLVIARDADQAGMREITGALEAQAALATGRVGAPELAGALEVAAALASVQNTPLRAVRLAGAAAALRARSNRPLATVERRLAPARQALSAAEQAAAWVEGQAITPEQAIAYALEAAPMTVTST